MQRHHPNTSTSLCWLLWLLAEAVSTSFSPLVPVPYFKRKVTKVKAILLMKSTSERILPTLYRARWRRSLERLNCLFSINMDESYLDGCFSFLCLRIALSRVSGPSSLSLCWTVTDGLHSLLDTALGRGWTRTSPDDSPLVFLPSPRILAVRVCRQAGHSLAESSMPLARAKMSLIFF